MAVARKYLLKQTETILGALKRVSKNGAGFAAVVDDDDRFIGTFCDLDGRLAMLRGVSLDEPVSSVMAKKSARADRLPGELAVKSGKVVDIVLYKRPPVEAVVMAGGKGTRLRSVTGGVPKPLLNLGRRSIVERILGHLASAGVDDAWLAVNYKANQFEKRIGDGACVGLSVKYLHESTPLGRAGSLSMLPAKGAPYVFVTNADLITAVDYERLFDFHRSHEGPITMAAANVSTTLKYGVLDTTDDGVLKGMDEKPDLSFLCNAGMYMLDRSVIKLVPKNTFFEMPDLFDAVRRRGGNVHVFPMYEKWVDAGSPEEFQQVLIEFATGVES